MRNKALIESLQATIAKDNQILSDQNKEIVRLQEENRQLRHLLGLYEACINKGIKIDFPDVTGKQKGGYSQQTGYKGMINTDDIKY